MANENESSPLGSDLPPANPPEDSQTEASQTSASQDGAAGETRGEPRADGLSSKDPLPHDFEVLNVANHEGTIGQTDLSFDETWDLLIASGSNEKSIYLAAATYGK